MKKNQLAVLAVVVLTLSFASAAKAGSAYTVGDVFVAVTGVGVEEFTPTGTLVQTISDSSVSSSGFITGMAFQNNGNLLVTGFSSGNVVQFDNAGNLLNATWTTGISLPESIAIDSTGNVYVSSVGGTGITEYTSAGGAAISTSIAGTRTDWIDLSADQHTMLYTDEGGNIHSVNVATNTSNPDVYTNSGSGAAQYALRIIPSGTFAGDILVAGSTAAYLIDPTTGKVLMSYAWAQNDGSDFALNLDPNGTAFWTSDTSGDVAEFDIATGNLLESWKAGTGSFDVFGLVVFGQITASGGGGGTTGGGGTSVPEPGTLTLLTGGLISLAGFAKKRLLV